MRSLIFALVFMLLAATSGGDVFANSYGSTASGFRPLRNFIGWRVDVRQTRRAKIRARAAARNHARAASYGSAGSTAYSVPVVTSYGSAGSSGAYAPAAVKEVSKAAESEATTLDNYLGT